MDTAQDTIAELKEVSRLTTLRSDMNLTKKKLDVGENIEMEFVKKENENLFEPLFEEPKSWGMKVTNLSSIALARTSPVRRG